MEMTFNGEFEVAIPRQQAFALLSDPEKFAPMMPTFHSMRMKDERNAVLKVKVGIGKITAIATTELILEKAVSPSNISYLGKGKVLGGAYNMVTAFELQAASDNSTLIKWQGTTQIFGKILSLAGGGMRGYAEKEIENLITSLQHALAHPDEVASVESTSPSPLQQPSWFTRLWRAIFGGGEAKQPLATISSSTTSPSTSPSQSIAERIRAEQAAQARKPLPAVGERQSMAAHKPMADPIAANKEKNQNWVGRPVNRKEDSRLLRGRGRFVDDYQAPGMLHMAFVRSAYAHARILNVDVSQAEALPGVICTLTGKELAENCGPYMQLAPGEASKVEDYAMAVEKVVYQGEPVVAVVAVNPRIAADAAELVDVEYEMLEAVVDTEEALKDNIIVHEKSGTNQTWSGNYTYGDVDKAFEDAAHVVKIDRLHFHRFASTPLETNGAVATWDKQDNIDIFCNNGFPTIGMQMMAPAMGVSIDKIRCHTHDSGGSFGNKICSYTLMTVAAIASRKAGGAPVKYIETRSESLFAPHGAERTFLDTEVALDKDGVIIAIRSRHIDDCGAFARYEPLGCVIFTQVLPATYKLRNIHIDFVQAATNRAPAVPNRGYSRLQQLWFMERVIDICAHKLNIPADKMRLNNYISEFPYETPNGCVYDSGDYGLMLQKAKELIGWDDWKQKQLEARRQGRWLGIGIGSTLDSGTNNFGQAQIMNPNLPFSGNSEVAVAKLDLDGTLVISNGACPSGQGHETVISQVVADTFNISPDMVNVHTGFDTARNSHAGHSGSYASQFVVTGLLAVQGAADKLKQQMSQLAACMLEVDEDQLEYGVGEMGPQVGIKSSDVFLPYWAIANRSHANCAGLPPELMDVSLNIRHVYRAPFQVPDIKRKFGNLTLTYAAQIHISVVEVDRHTLKPHILDYVAIDDCGVQINPKIVRGQVHGATAHGIGAALMEKFDYDKAGNLMSSTFTEYTPITINNMPEIKCDHIESPSPFTENGAKGCGEGGGAPLHTISAAVQDALYEQGVMVTDSYNSPSAINDMLNNKGKEGISLVSRQQVPETV